DHLLRDRIADDVERLVGALDPADRLHRHVADGADAGADYDQLFIEHRGTPERAVAAAPLLVAFIAPAHRASRRCSRPAAAERRRSSRPAVPPAQRRPASVAARPAGRVPPLQRRPGLLELSERAGPPAPAGPGPASWRPPSATAAARAPGRPAAAGALSGLRRCGPGRLTAGCPVPRATARRGPSWCADRA